MNWINITAEIINWYFWAISIYSLLMNLILWFPIVRSIWFLRRHWLVIAFDWIKNTILLLLYFSNRRFSFKCNTFTWGFHVTFGHLFRYKVILRITISSFEWGFWFIICDSCWSFWNCRIVRRYVLYVVIISSRSYQRKVSRILRFCYITVWPYVWLNCEHLRLGCSWKRKLFVTNKWSPGKAMLVFLPFFLFSFLKKWSRSFYV